jgi:glycosyltransferase involved in cell wall biosynthesis
LPRAARIYETFLRIVLIINGLVGGGGAERMLVKLVTALSPRFEPLVISLTERGDLANQLQSAGVEVKALGLKGASSFPGAFARLTGTLRWFKPHAINTWLYHSDLIGGLAARAAGIRSIAWNIRNSTLPEGHARATTRAVLRLNASLSNKVPRLILCCSEVARQIHVDAGYDASRIRVIPNGFDLSRFQPDALARAEVRQEIGVPDDVPLVGMIARWHPQKNHHGFIEAAAALRKRIPTVQFLLSGLGLDRSNEALTGWIREAGLENAVHLVGYRQDVPRLMAALDLATLSSTFGEAFPNVLGEAMACGVPCVSTDVGDAAAIVGDTGIIVPPGNAEALTSAWDAMLSRPGELRLQLGQRARNRVQDHFELISVVKKYEHVFDELAAT